jgi:hypothetical protein
MKTRIKRQRTKWDMRLRFYPFIAAGLALIVYATGGEVARGVVHDDAHGTSLGRSATHDGIAAKTAGSIPVPVAPSPVWGVDGKGKAYSVERNPPWPMLEFKVMFTGERR